jgi:hypothetical protein
VGANRGLLILVLILGTVALMLGSVWFSVWSAQHHEVYQLVLAHARANPVVIDALGEPVNEQRVGPFAVGTCSQISIGGVKTAVAMVRLEGPKSRGVVNATATMTTGSWEFSSMDLDLGTTSACLLPDPARFAF